MVCTDADKKLVSKDFYNELTEKFLSISATVASNALTLGLGPCYLYFRNPILTTGTPNIRNIASSLSLVIPSGATLGTVNAVAARLILLAIDNAGTIELAVVNQSGGNNLDETTLISTTAISDAADSTDVIYSANARNNVPFRVVGFIDITEATAGTWASAPTLVQGYGGQALMAMSGLGYGQTWQSLAASRSINVTYYNTTKRPIIVILDTTAVSAMHFEIGGVNMGAYPASTLIVTYIIPIGQSYQFAGSSVTISSWCELR
jgi:hypothetical protein